MSRLHVSISDETKRLLEAYVEKQDGLTQGDVVDDALRLFFQRRERPDLALDRIAELTYAVMDLSNLIRRREEDV